jgi:hypothetical protein
MHIPDSHTKHPLVQAYAGQTPVFNWYVCDGQKHIP